MSNVVAILSGRETDSLEAEELLFYLAVPIVLLLALTAVMAWLSSREREVLEIETPAGEAPRDD